MPKMKVYIIETRRDTMLAYAPSSKQARLMVSRLTGVPYIEARALSTRGVIENYLPLCDLDKVAAGESHIVTDPLYCESCYMIGGGIDQGRCELCGQYPGDDIRDAFAAYERMKNGD